MKIDWEYLEKQVKELSNSLSELTRERDKLSRYFNLLTTEKSKLKNDYSRVLKESVSKKDKLFKIHRDLNERKKEWFLSGGTSEDFCLDVEGYSLELELKSLVKRDINYIKNEPKSAKEKYNDYSKRCDKILEMIKSYDSKIKTINQQLSHLHLHEEIKSHSYSSLDGSLFVEMEVYQLSVKRKKTYLNHKKYYNKNDDVWYRTYDNLKKKKVLSSDDLDALIQVLNKYFKDTRINVT